MIRIIATIVLLMVVGTCPVEAKEGVHKPLDRAKISIGKTIKDLERLNDSLIGTTNTLADSLNKLSDKDTAKMKKKTPGLYEALQQNQNILILSVQSASETIKLLKASESILDAGSGLTGGKAETPDGQAILENYKKELKEK